jgi:L-fuculose-phosphate aldolase
MMYDRGLIGGPSGNVSARVGPDRVLLTPSMPFKQFLQPTQIIAVDLDGRKVGPETEANRDLRASSELPTHLDVYRLRPDVGGIVHAHPTYCVALSTAGIALRTNVLTEGMLFLGFVPTADYGMPTTKELSDTVAEFITDHNAVVMSYHGTLTVGEDVMQAYARMEVLEQVAQIQCIVESLGGEKPLPRDQIAKLLELRRRMGHATAGDAGLLE